MAPPPPEEVEEQEIINHKFKDGEKVLCFHGPLLYEAKCLKAQVKDKTTKYYIHYSGWNKNWDEWVPESRVLKYNEVNMQKRRDLEVINSKERKKSGKGGAKKDPKDRESSVLPPQEKTPKQKNKDAEASAASTSNETPTEPPKKKRMLKAEQNVETEEEYIQKIEIKIKIADELKHRIVEDWNCINREGKLASLPARIPVETLISDYVKQRTSVKGMTPNKESAIVEIMNGVKEYFNVMLGPQLLYDLELPQYNKLISEYPDSTPCQLYGVSYLLRLFTMLGGILVYTPLNEDSIHLISTNITDLQKYIAKWASTFFSNSDYIDGPEKKSIKKEIKDTKIKADYIDGPEKKSIKKEIKDTKIKAEV
ncbi:hypothetical protein JTE90_016132 [Oedothorax gibbosus]|uniref:Chromo domain-containing protein n=1 Tax=Oedothorax gibbosus TaxID=931172 RepID=A0AAV6U4W2_9ARAC|nr:hypothetical protein JTE90_016132 [Oedothorax gibbosus]